MHNYSRLLRVSMALGTMMLVGSLVAPGLAQAGAKTALLSKSSVNERGNSESSEASISKTGRFIAFHSMASNLVAGDTNGTYDCFVRDQAGTTERVSVDSDGLQANGRCWGPAISDSGRYVAFGSNATNLISGDTNGTQDIYVHDRWGGKTRRVSIATGGEQANGESSDPAISADGRYVAFESEASNLVPGDTNGNLDIFVHDRNTGTTTRVSVRSNGKQANGDSHDPDFSADGRFIVFDSNAANLVFKDTNGRRDVFIHNQVSGTTKLVSLSSSEKQGKLGSRNASVSKDGRYVAFDSDAKNLVRGDTSASTDVFLRDRQKGTTKRMSVSNSERQAAGSSRDAKISDNGRWITFESKAANLVSKDTNKKIDVFVRDRIKKTTRIVSKTASGGQAKFGDSDDPTISGDGRYIAFESRAKNIVANDNNGAEDVFRRGPLQ